MPPVVGALGALGGALGVTTATGAGSALAGGLAVGGTAAALYGAKKDRDVAKDATKRAEQQRQRSQDFIDRQIKQGRSDVFKLFPAAQQARHQGIQAGMDTFSQALPVQLGAFQQGNMGAQRAIAQGLPQFQNAILGQPVNMGAFQPQQINTPGIQGLLNPQVPPPVAPQFNGIQGAGAQPWGGGGAPQLLTAPGNAQGFIQGRYPQLGGF